MLRFSVITLLLLVAVTLTACPSQTRGGKRIPNAVVELKVDPPDAAVIIDGKLIGNAWDLQLLQLSPGEHKIEIRKAGYVPYIGKLDAGPTNLLQVQLKRPEE